MQQGSAVPSILQTLRTATVLTFAGFVLAVVATGGCSSSSTPSPGSSPTVAPSVGTPSPTPPPSPTPTAVNFVILNYASVPPTNDPTYGQIDGIGQATAAPSATPFPVVVSSVVTVHCNKTIQFYNLDRLSPHTASLLGPASGSSWPLFNNVNGATTATPQFTGALLTPITYPQFSTGTMFALGAGGSSSFVYSTGPSAGAFYFEDYYEYTASPLMRTVINILCP